MPPENKKNGKLLKWLIGVFGVCILTFFIYGCIWVVSGIYGAEKYKATTQECIQAMKQDITEIKEDGKIATEEMKKQNEKINKNQEEILKMFLEIKKYLK